MNTPYYTVDVFTDKAFNGAQIAVFTEADDFSEATKQTLATELNLSNTVFVDSNSDGFHLSNYNAHGPQGFGSHTTIAAANALAAADKITVNGTTPVNFSYNNGSYSVALERSSADSIFTQMSLSTKPVVDNYVPSTSEMAEILGINAQELECKPFYSKLVLNEALYLVVPVRSFKAVREARFNLAAWQMSQAPSTLAERILLVSESTEHRTSDFHLRLMGTQISASEDPPVGSSIPAFAAFLCAHQHLALGTYSYTVERGTSATRQSILQVEMDHKGNDTLTVRIGGNGILMSSGHMRIDTSE